MDKAEVMKSFKSIGAFLEYLPTIIAEMEIAEHVGLEKVGALIETEAKHEIGHYQEAVGPFGAWAPLTQNTLNGFFLPSGRWIDPKVNQPPDNPLDETGELRASISHTVGEHEVTIGSPLQLAVWQELGVNEGMPYEQPPRSFLGGAAFRKRDKAVDTVVGHIVAAMAGVSVSIFE